MRTGSRCFRVSRSVLLYVVVWSGIAAAETIELKAEAYVKGPMMKLGEVASIKGDAFEELADLEIGPAPLPGETRKINAALVAARLKSAGVETEGMEILGAKDVKATTLHLEVSRQMISESLREFILAEMPWDPSLAEVDVPLPTGDVVTPDGDLEIAWRPSPEYQYIGAGVFRGALTVDGELQKTLLMKANVEAYGEVLVAASDLTRGTILGPNDIVPEERALSNLPRGAVLNGESALGMVVTRTVFAGQILTSRCLSVPTLIKRNQIVPVELRSGTLRIQSQAKALSDGRAGDTILCSNVGSKDQFQGVVRADGVVTVE